MSTSDPNNSNVNDTFREREEALNHQQERIAALRTQLEEDRNDITALRAELNLALQSLAKSTEQNLQRSEELILIQKPSSLMESYETDEVVPDWMKTLPSAERKRLRQVISNLDRLAKSLQGPQDVLDLQSGNARPFPVSLPKWSLPKWKPVPADFPTSYSERLLDQESVE